MKSHAPNAERMAIRRENLDRQIAHAQGIVDSGQRRDPFTDESVDLTRFEMETYRAHLAALKETRAAL